MSYNRSLLNFITKNLDKKPSKPRVPRNQWQHPGEVTKVNSPNITMDAVSYPVLGVPNVGQPQMMYPNEQYNFPGASNVTEFPQMQPGGAVGNFINAAKAVGNYMINQPDSNAENIAEVFDPFGTSSWDDVIRSYNESGMSGQTALEVLGAVPFFGKLGKLSKPGIHLKKYQKLDKALYKNLPKNNIISNGFTGLGAAGKVTDAYQAYDQYAEGGEETGSIASYLRNLLTPDLAHSDAPASIRTADKKQSIPSKAWDAVTHPVTAFKHMVRDGRLPNNFAAAAPLGIDTALDVTGINPLGWFDTGLNAAKAAGRIVTGEGSLGDFITAPMSAIGLMPGVNTARKIVGRHLQNNSNIYSPIVNTVGKGFSKVGSKVNQVDQKLGKTVFKQKGDLPTVPNVDPSDLESIINYNLRQGQGIKKLDLPIEVKVRHDPHSAPGNNFVVDNLIGGNRVGSIQLRQNLAPYQPPSFTRGVINIVNPQSNKWINTPGFQKVSDFPFNETLYNPLEYAGKKYTQSDFVNSGISGELNKAINETLKANNLGNILSGGTGHTNLGAHRWENLVNKGFAEKLGKGQYMLRKNGGPINYQNGGVTPVPVWNTYKSHLGNVYIMDGIKMPDGSINTTHPDVGKVNFVDSMNPSGGDALSAGYGYGRATRSPEGNWVYPNPVNPKKTHPYVRVEEQMPDTRRKRSLYLNSPWSDDADKQDVINDIKRYKYQEGGQKYTVKEGEYLSQIAKANNISVEDLVLANKISNPNLIKPNQELIIPAATRGYSNPGAGGFQGFEQLQRTQEALSKLPSDQMVKEYRKQFNVPGNYAMVDKKAGKMFIYDQTGKELKNFPVGTGKVLGDEYTINTTGPTRRNSTPAGIFTLTNKGSGRDSYAPHYGDNIWEMIDHNGVQQATALHQVPNELPYRNALIGDANPANNRLSNGCINCRRKDFDTGVEKFLGKDSQVYILPEDQNNYFQVKNNKLVLTGDKYNPDVLYSKKDLTARPLQIKYAKSQFPGSLENVQQMTQALVDKKQQLMKDLKIDNDTYNELTRLTLGITGQESNYGDHWKYKYKESPEGQNDVRAAKVVRNIGDIIMNPIDAITNPKNPFSISPNSRGFTQIKYGSQNKDVRNLFAKYGIKSPDDLADPAKSNIAALIMLGYMHNNELPQLKDKMKKLNLSKSDALLYLNQGKKSQITNMTATPQQNKYIRSVNDYAKRFVLNQKEQGGPVMGQQLEVSPDEMAELRKQGYKFKVVK